MAGQDDIEVKFELPDLNWLLGDLKDFDERLARDIRRELRGTGDDIIAAQRKILMGRLPGPIRKVGTRLVWVRPRDGRRPYLAKRNVYQTGDGSEGGIDNLRSKIRKGLRTRVTSTKSRSQISVKTTGPRQDGYNAAKFWNAKVFRHPVFSHAGATFVYQQGQPYFFGPAYAGVEDMQTKTSAILDRALAALSRG